MRPWWVAFYSACISYLSSSFWPYLAERREKKCLVASKVLEGCARHFNGPDSSKGLHWMPGCWGLNWFTMPGRRIAAMVLYGSFGASEDFILAIH